MPERAPDVADLEEEMADAVRPIGEIAAVYLYGSAATGDTTALSDVDVAVLLVDPAPDPAPARMARARLAGEMSRRFPCVSFDVRGLEELPLAVQGRVVTAGKLLVDRDPSRRVAFEVRTRLRYFDFLPFQQVNTREGLRALRERFGSG